jgi:glycosyltransferase involved in cell wall biosynthesis
VLVWDDGSTDQSIAIAQAYAKRDLRIRFVAAQHRGLAPALKAAISATRGKFIGWVDSDDLLAPTALAETAIVLEMQPQVGMVYTNYEVLDAQGQNHGMGQLCKIPYSQDQLLVDFMTFHFRLMRRTVYDEVGGIDASYAIAEDYDLCLKLSEVTQIRQVPRSLYFYRRHTHNVTNLQFAKIEWTQKAINAAIQRRGLASNFELDTRLVSYFSLRTKSTAAEISLPATAKTTTPLVSIIIPCHNAAPRIDECLKSCVEQTYPHLEIIVVENGSTDDSVERVQQWIERSDRMIKLLSNPQLGANVTRNLGHTQARGEYTQWLDADDELRETKIANQVAALATHPEYDIAFSDWQWWFHLAEGRATFQFPGRPEPDMLLQLLIDNWRPPHSYLLRRSASQRLHELRAWHPDRVICQDREYFTIAALLGFQFLYVPECEVIYHHWSPNQLTRGKGRRDRIESRNRMCDRFQDFARMRWSSGLDPVHQFLLTRSWEVWSPAFTIDSRSKPWLLQHQHAPLTLPVPPQHQQIFAALVRVPSPQTLEDYARLILHRIWQQRQEAKTAIGLSQASSWLATQIGLRVALEATTSSAIASSAAKGQERHPLVNDFPLFTPALGEHRLVIQGVIHRLCEQGWLRR